MKEDVEKAYSHLREARRLLGREIKRLRVDPVSYPKHPTVRLFVKAAELEEQLLTYIGAKTMTKVKCQNCGIHVKELKTVIYAIGVSNKALTMQVCKECSELFTTGVVGLEKESL